MSPSTRFFSLFSILLSAVFFCSVSAQSSIKAKPTLRMINQLSGLYNNKAEADTATSQLRAPQEFRVYRVFEEQEEYWLYWGWFSANMPDFPLEERLVKVVSQDGHNWTLQSYYIPTHQGFGREWEKRKPFASIDLKKLEESDCQSYIEQTATTIRWHSEPCKRKSAMLPFDYARMDFTFDKKGGKMISRTVFLQEDKETELFRHQEHRFDLVSRHNLSFPFDVSGSLED